MPDVSVKIDTKRLDQLDREIPGKADRIVGAIAYEFEAYVKQSFSSPSPSPADSESTPAVDTGTLKNSIHAEKIQDRLWRVVDGVMYGIFLEFGTRHMSARPFFQPAALEIEKRVTELFRTLFS